jgi:hypothetical protein
VAELDFSTHCRLLCDLPWLKPVIKCFSDLRRRAGPGVLFAVLYKGSVHQTQQRGLRLSIPLSRVSLWVFFLNSHFTRSPDQLTKMLSLSGIPTPCEAIHIQCSLYVTLCLPGSRTPCNCSQRATATATLIFSLCGHCAYDQIIEIIGLLYSV